jgi:hypothetical protein
MKSNPTVPLIIIALVLAGGGYWYYSGQTGNQPPLTASAGEGEVQTQFKMLVSELKNISFDTDIFSNPNFLALTDLATQVAPESSGRLDPFAPLVGASAKNEE